MSNTELTRAMNAVPSILDALGVAKDIAAPICEALVKYGCRNQEAIAKVAITAMPEFAKVSNEFFSLLDRIINLPDALPQQEYDILLQIILNDASANLQEKTNSMTESINSLKDNQFNHKMRIIKKIGLFSLSICAIIGATLIFFRGLTVYQQIKKEREKTHRTNIRLNTFSNTVHEFFHAISPFSVISDILFLYLKKE